MIIWGHQPITLDLGHEAEEHCPTRGLSRRFHNVVEYQRNHLYYLLRFVSGKRYSRVCLICGRGQGLNAQAIEGALGRNPIPSLDRFGMLGGAVGLLALIGLGALTALLGETPRNIPTLIDKAKAGDRAAVERLLREAREGDMPSEEALSTLYRQGWGVEKDPAQAFHWARLAANHGSAWAWSRTPRPPSSGFARQPTRTTAQERSTWPCAT